MQVHNPNPDRPLLANVFGQWYEIPAAESIEVEDAAVVTSLIEYGATADKLEVEAALAVHGNTNRGINSRTASASASEGEILGRQQRTVDVARSTVEGGGELKGAALEAAVREANAAGAEINVRGTAGERREALAAWQVRQGSSSAPDVEGFEVDAAGNLILDSEGQPIEVGSEAYARDENGAIVLSEDGSPVATPQDEETGASDTDVPTGLGVDDAGTGDDED